MASIHVTVWGEFIHEQRNPVAALHYPRGMHETIADFLRQEGDLKVRTATLAEPDHGLAEAVLQATDVLIWWGHLAHGEVRDEIVERVKQRVLEGMGFIALHSAHESKIFTSLMGTRCTLRWREGNDKERLWNIYPSHPIASGIGACFELPVEEMYGEPFDIPAPEEVIFISWFTGGEVFRSGLTWRRGHGRIFYFRPGHETHPTYRDPVVQRVIINAVNWARPTVKIRSRSEKAAPLESSAST